MRQWVERGQGRDAERDARSVHEPGEGERGGHEEHTRQERDQPGRAVDGSREQRAEREQKGEERGEHHFGFSGEPDVGPTFEEVLGDPGVLAPVPFQHRAVMDAPVRSQRDRPHKEHSEENPVG